MLDGKRVAVVVPAHDEEKLIAETIRSIPAFVDRVYVVDDGSQDGTVAAARAAGDARVEAVEHERNLGVGAAILTGYRRALEERVDVTAVMAADAQMDPADLEKLVQPLAVGDPPAQGRARDLVAPVQGLLVADAREVRDPRLPPARVLLPPRLLDGPARARPRDRGGRPADHGEPHHRGDGRACVIAPYLRVAV